MLYTGNRIGGSNPPLSASKGDSVSAESPGFVFARLFAELRAVLTRLSRGPWTETNLCGQIGDRVSGGRFATVVFSIAELLTGAKLLRETTLWFHDGCRNDCDSPLAATRRGEARRCNPRAVQVSSEAEHPVRGS